MLLKIRILVTLGAGRDVTGNTGLREYVFRQQARGWLLVWTWDLQKPLAC